MTNIWQKHPFQLLLYVEWVLLGIALLAALTVIISRLHWVSHSPLFSLGAILCIIALGIIGLKLPFGSKFFRVIYIVAGFSLTWLALLLLGRGERVFPAPRADPGLRRQNPGCSPADASTGRHARKRTVTDPAFADRAGRRNR